MRVELRSCRSEGDITRCGLGCESREKGVCGRGWDSQPAPSRAGGDRQFAKNQIHIR